MDERLKFIFDGLPVRGALVRLDSSWRDLLQRRASVHDGAHAYPAAVRALLGQMVAAGCLMQANIKFNGALVLQISGDGPVQLAVAEVQPDGAFRATAKVVADVPSDAQLEALVNVDGKGRCAITLDPRERLPGQQPYQGVVPLHGDQREPLQAVAQVLEHYMLQSEQLDTRLVLAADDEQAAGLLIQRLPEAGAGNLTGTAWKSGDEEAIGHNEAFNRIALLATTLTSAELLTLSPAAVLHRLFWQETLRVFPADAPRFACSCSRARVGGMLRGLGQAEVTEILAERGHVEVGCDFCGAQYRFDAVDAGELFAVPRDQPPASQAVQ